MMASTATPAVPAIACTNGGTLLVPGGKPSSLTLTAWPVAIDLLAANPIAMPRRRLDRLYGWYPLQDAVDLYLH
jgi:hypothetical protein